MLAVTVVPLRTVDSGESPIAAPSQIGEEDFVNNPVSHRLLVATAGLLLAAACTQTAPGTGPAGDVDARFVVDGQSVAIADGNAYVVASDGSLVFIKELYTPGEAQAAFRVTRNAVLRVGEDGKWYNVPDRLEMDFEDAKGVRDLIGLERGWTNFTLQSPAAPTVPDYVALFKSILAGGAGFEDNRVEPSEENFHRGAASLRTYAVAGTEAVPVSKASLSSILVHAVEGDTVDLSAWYFIEQGMPVGLMDLESSFIDQGPGMRVLADQTGRLRVELKWGDKPTYRSEAVLPVGRWTQLRLRILLSAAQSGTIELWVDNEPVIDATGQTLPLGDTILDRFEIGTTANNDLGPVTMFVDDVRIETRRVRTP